VERGRKGRTKQTGEKLMEIKKEEKEDPYNRLISLVERVFTAYLEFQKENQKLREENRILRASRQVRNYSKLVQQALVRFPED
jgi:hypothetical protein